MGPPASFAAFGIVAQGPLRATGFTRFAAPALCASRSLLTWSAHPPAPRGGQSGATSAAREA